VPASPSGREGDTEGEREREKVVGGVSERPNLVGGGVVETEFGSLKVPG
jgi:hypothetical protein